MIKVDKNNGCIEGKLSLILAELTVAIESVYNAIKDDLGEEKAKEIIKQSYDAAFKTKEEIEEETKDMLKKLLKLLTEDND